MKKQVLNYLILVLISMFAINSVLAEILIGQPSSLYNIGDRLSITISINPSTDINDFLINKIVCENGEVEIYKTPAYVEASEPKNITLEVKLDKSLIGDISGLCFIQSSFGPETAKGQPFELSKKINVALSLTNSIIAPGEKLTISGTAKKSNGQTSQAFVETSIPGLNSTLTSRVTDGQFTLNLVIPTNAAAGSYDLNIHAYEKESSGLISNEGFVSTQIKVKQVIKKIDIAIDKPSLIPENNISYTVLLHDQSESDAQEDVRVSLYTSSGEVYSSGLVRSGESNTIEIPQNASPGYWTIEASYLDLNEKKSFLIEEVEKASFILENQTLTIKNIGNVPYTRMIEIGIDENKEIKQLNLDVNGVKRFKLLAPEGAYAVSIKESNNTLGLGSSFLTGSAIGIKDLDTLSLAGNIAFWVWAVIITILIIVAIAYYLKVRRRSFVGVSPSGYQYKEEDRFHPYSHIIDDKSSSRSEEKPNKFETYSAIPAASKTSAPLPVSTQEKDSNKEEVAIIALKIKNSEKLIASESSAFATIDVALQKARSAKAKVYDKGDFKIIVLAEKLTKIQDNAFESLKIANEINQLLREHNKRFAIKIEYGIGVNVGEMFFESIDGRAKFTSVGNTMIVAKNAAEKANSEIFASREAYRKVSGKVKAEQTPSNLYRILSVIDRSQHSEFIQRFMKKKDS